MTEERALTRNIKKYTNPVPMQKLAFDLPDNVRLRVGEIAHAHGFTTKQAFSFRRGLLKCVMGMKSFHALNGNSPQMAELLAAMFEDTIEAFLRERLPATANITTEAQRKAVVRDVGERLGPTPDFTFDPPIKINGVTVNWIDAKLMYASHTFLKKRFMPEGHLAATAAKYNTAFGPGAFVFGNGFCQELAELVPAMLLDSGPLDDMAKIDALVENSRVPTASLRSPRQHPRALQTRVANATMTDKVDATVEEVLASLTLAAPAAAPEAAPAAEPAAAPAAAPTDVNDDDAKIVLVDRVETLAKVVDKLMAAGDDVAADFEGIDLSRSGELCIAQLATTKQTFIVDIVAMGKPAFTDGKLGALLESNDVLKVIYDGRADADALFHQFDVQLANVYDVQIASVERQCKLDGRRDRFVHGLGKAIGRFEEEQGIVSTNGAIKQAGKKLFAPEHGGSYDVWKDRPLNPVLIEYAAIDVVVLHSMKDAWVKYSTLVLNKLVAERRLAKAVGGMMPAKGKQMALRDW
jgi:exonuclease 3'-5' domain-containing protein 1